MRTIKFTIKGNHKSPTGNAAPKLRMTGKQQWTPKAQEYVLWKEHVVKALIDAVKEPGMTITEYGKNVARFGKPITLGPIDHAMMTIMIYWSNKARGDAENIFGSIADALFVNDKNLNCVALWANADEIVNGKPQGKVDVTIRLFDDEKEKLSFIKKYQ